jgi:hypothetical protein
LLDEETDSITHLVHMIIDSIRYQFLRHQITFPLYVSNSKEKPSQSSVVDVQKTKDPKSSSSFLKSFYSKSNVPKDEEQVNENRYRDLFLKLMSDAFGRFSFLTRIKDSASITVKRQPLIQQGQNFVSDYIFIFSPAYCRTFYHIFL